MAKCDCIEKMENAAKEHVIKNKTFKKTVISARMKGMAMMFNPPLYRSYSEVEFELEGQKKKPTLSMVHTYCPFCGIKVTGEE